MSRKRYDSRVSNRFIIWIFYDADLALMLILNTNFCIWPPYWVINNDLKMTHSGKTIFDEWYVFGIKLYVKFNGYFSS